MEQSYEAVKKRITHLNNLLNNNVLDSKVDAESCLISREALIDSLLLLYDECNNEFLMKDSHIASFIEKYRSSVLRLRDLTVNINDFEIRKVINKGRFAEVSVAKEKASQCTYVLKKIRKSDILNTAQRIYFENERNLLITASTKSESRKWIPRLHYSFQNMKYIYYVLEYCPGGNLCTVLEYYKKNVPEPMLKFYVTEMIQAINSIHAIGYVHRDIRPDNILIDENGHLKLVDFGSSAKLSKHGQITSKVILTSTHYTAPEILKFESSTIKGYSLHCDWWSLGAVLFELLTGTVPFTSDEISKLHLWSANYTRKLLYPKHIIVSQELRNIINGLIQPVEKRLTYRKLVQLDYFNDVDWTNLQERDPPYMPCLASDDDTSYFTTYEVQRPTPKVDDFKLQRRFTGRNLPFLGFTYMWNANPEDILENAISSTKISISQNIVPGNCVVEKSRVSDANPKQMLNKFECTLREVLDKEKVIKTSDLKEMLQSFEKRIVSAVNEVQVDPLKKEETQLDPSAKTISILEAQIERLNTDLEKSRETAILQREAANQAKKDLAVAEKQLSELKADLRNAAQKSRVSDVNPKQMLNKFECTLREVLDKENAIKASDMEKMLESFEKRIMLPVNEVQIEPLKKNITVLEAQIERLEANLKKSNEAEIQQREIANKARKDLVDAEKQLVELKVELQSAQREAKEANDKVRRHRVSDVSPKQMLKQFESTLREVLTEHSQNKEKTIKTSDFEKMFSICQQRIVLPAEETPLDPAAKNVFVLEAQIERLNADLEKSRETAILQREAATQAKKDLAVAEKQLSDLKIDLRIAQREAKEADEKVKKLRESKYTYYNDLKTEKENLESKLKNEQEKIHELQLEMENCMKTEKENFEAKLKIEQEKFNKLELELENFKKLVDLKKEEVSWKKKYENLEKNANSVKETCLMLDKEVERLEEYTQTLNEKIVKYEEEKLELQNELERTNEEVKNAKKVINEEKSLKAFLENKIRILESDIEKKVEERDLLEGDVNSREKLISELKEQVKQYENYFATTSDSIEKHTQFGELMKKDIMSLKQERTELLTSIHRLKEENAALKQEIKEATEDLNDLQQANGELQSALTQVEAYHEIRHLKDNATLQQHSKLIEFLQTKFHDASKQKPTFADMLFGSRGKENLNPKELENLLYLERNKSKGLADQLYQAQIELMMLKGEKCSSPKLPDKSLTTSSNPLTGVSTNISATETPIARIRHNIPHKFETKMCTKTGCKCVSCGNTINFGHKMSYCKECHVWSHVSCSVKIGPSCGLPPGLSEECFKGNITHNAKKPTSPSTSRKVPTSPKVRFKSEQPDLSKECFKGNVMYAPKKPNALNMNQVLPISSESIVAAEERLYSSETTDDECIQKSLNISRETEISLNSSTLESSADN